MTTNPYAKYVEGTDVMASLADTPQRIAAIVRAWPATRFEESHAAGKWTARQVLIHLAHIEMVASVRLRFVLAAEAHVIQTFEQDDWMRVDHDATAADALGAYLAMRRMNLALLRTLSDAQRARHATHPDFGEISVAWIMTWLAGHELNHRPQFEASGIRP
jgi:hypothetical protein